MPQTNPGRGFTEIQAEEWTVILVTEDVDEPGVKALGAAIRPSLVAGARVALDLRRFRLDPASGPAAVQGWIGVAATQSATLVVVASDERTRALLRDSGIHEVYESLDAAAHIRTPPRPLGGSQPPGPPLLPAAGDTLLVQTEDSLGVDPSL